MKCHTPGEHSRSGSSERARAKRMERAIVKELPQSRPTSTVERTCDRITEHAYTPSFQVNGKNKLVRRVMDYRQDGETFVWSKPAFSRDVINGASDRVGASSSSRSPRNPQRKIVSCRCKKCREARRVPFPER